MITIPSTFNGPVDSGHGGFAAGRFAEVIDPRRARVKLHRPIPLGTMLKPATCYGCGTARTGGGLDLRPGPVPGHDVHAAAWSPHRRGDLPAWLVWAAAEALWISVARPAEERAA